MKKAFLTFVLLIFAISVFSQTETFDIVSYTAPKGWKKEAKENSVVYSKINGGSWSQIILYKNTVSKGTAEKDFESEWQELVVKNYSGISKPEKEKTESAGGWTIMSGSGNWKFNGTSVATILTVYSGHGACVSFVCNATANSYLQEYLSFISKVVVNNGKDTPQNNVTANNTNQNQATTINAKKDKYAFNTTNFDDGWTSTVQEDWVETSKGNIKVLIHFPKEGTIFPADPDKLTTAAWNILVAPRYSNLINFKTAYIESFNRPYFGMGNAKENKSGKSVFVVLFRRGGGWIEIVTPDSKTFTQEFGFNPETIRWGRINEYLGGYIVDNSQGQAIKADEPEVYNKLDNMSGKNKFAVAASDLNNSGEWKDRFSSNTFYSNYYTGAYMGMSTFSSTKWFVFKPGFKYHWELIMANSYGGQTNIAQGKGDGTYKSLNNWQLYFTDIDGSPKTFDVYFSAIKGGRVLWMNDAQYPGSGIFSGFTLTK